ncbi:cobalt/nickel transport system permease protein [Kaistia soli DSM 19436]|uniref:Cobalt/nickel transport system permease protein n=1 Tax=Kaistia soli DSM 19436 TaxID=1122133 RepID=A0A1M5I8U6_9HYPH|nr:cobalt ECF transporter T component CbiQ [Kaistia soli]SHG24705.1 cobalt/nickel transport system permease protein [Kaistia soli DSM 19436]
MMLPGDPRLRLVAALLIVASISQLKSLPVAGIALVLVLATVLISRPKRGVWLRLLHVEGFMLLLFATLPFTVEGPPLLTIGPFTASAAGLWRAILIAMKVSASVLTLTVLLGDIEPTRLGATLRDLHVPERLNRLIVMTVRYIDLIRDEARRLHESMRARGFAPRSNRHTWRSYGNLVGMLLVRSLDRAARVEEAMLCRGYSGRFPYRGLPIPTRLDWIRFTLISSLGILAVMADRL